MKATIEHIYNYLNYKPQIGILSAITSYVLAIKTVMLTDETLKVVATISTCAGCVVACLSALSMLFKAGVAMAKAYRSLRLRFKK